MEVHFEQVHKWGGGCFFQISETELIILQCNGAAPLFQCRDEKIAHTATSFTKPKDISAGDTSRY